MATQILAEYVTQEIAGIFERVAEKIGSGKLINDLMPDEAAGVPMAIFVAHMAMEDAWRNYLASFKARKKHKAQI